MSNARPPLRPPLAKGAARKGNDNIQSDGGQEQPASDDKPLRITRRRIPELAIGVVMLGLGAIGALLLSGDENSKVPVLIWADDVVRGQDVTAEDLAVAEIETDVPVDVVRASLADEVIGRRALFRFASGSFVSPSMLASDVGLRINEAVVGLRLGPGQYPGGTLSPGDVVDLVLPELRPGWDSPMVATGVQVFEVEWLGDSGGGDALVSLLIPRAIAAKVVEASIAGVRLVEVAA